MVGAPPPNPTWRLWIAKKIQLSYLGEDGVASQLADAEARLSNIDSQISLPQADADAVYHEKASVTLERLARLEQVMMDEIDELKKLVDK